jgi:hypothetical protein
MHRLLCALFLVLLCCDLPNLSCFRVFNALQLQLRLLVSKYPYFADHKVEE